MNTPFWFRLARDWCLQGGTGLTLPFIVGADARFRKCEATPEDVRRILNEMLAFESNDGFLIIRWCPHRIAYVFGLFPFRHGKLEIDPALINQSTTEAKLLEQIAQHSEARVRAREFSRIGVPADWAPFQDRDLEFIDAVASKRT